MEINLRSLENAAYSVPLLGLKSCLDLNLIKFIFNVQQGTASELVDANQILMKFQDVFNGIGRFPGKYHISLKDDVEPVVNGARNFPISIRDKVKATLDDMEANGIIVKVDEPTDWVHSAHPVPKGDGTYRIVLDPRHLNKAIRREHFQMPTLQDVTSQLANQKLFSVFDVKSSFWQIELDHQSSLLTTHITPFGRYSYLRMPMGISSAGEVFQKRLEQVFEGVPGVYNLVDDILVTGSSVEEHNERLELMFSRARANGVKFNREKTQLCSTEVKFFGEILSSVGIRPDSSKVEDVKNMPSPQNAKDLQCYLGMFTYLSQFCPKLSARTAILRDLLGVRFRLEVDRRTRGGFPGH